MTAKEEYNKIRRNLRQQIKRMQKRGYFFPAGDPLPEVPKKITKASVRRLETIKKDIYEKARWRDSETGKETSGVRGQEIERARARKKAWEKRKKPPLPPPPPVYSMYERIKEELESRETSVYTRPNRQVIKVSFSRDAEECLGILEVYHNADPDAYEEYLSEHEQEIMDALEGSFITEQFMSDIGYITEAYQELKNLLRGEAADAPGELETEEEGFIIGDYDVPFY